MIDLGLNQYKITEIKYELKEGKTVIFKLRDFNLEDVEIIEEEIKEEVKESRSEFEKRKTREMIDVAKTSLNFSALGKEKKEAARDSMKGFLKEAKPIKNEYLEKSKKMISEDAEKDGKIIKERIEDRNQDKYYKLDPNDEYSSIKSLNDVDGKPLEIKKEENKIENETNGNDGDLPEVFLGFIKLVGEESDGYYRYEFIFTDNPDEFWGENFEYKPAGLVNDLIPSEEYITEVHTIKTKIKFDLIQNNMCFGLQDAMDGIVAIAFENIDEYESYPEEGRLFFMFGESYDDVERKLAMKRILMIN